MSITIISTMNISIAMTVIMIILVTSVSICLIIVLITFIFIFHIYITTGVSPQPSKSLLPYCERSYIDEIVGFPLAAASGAEDDKFRGIIQM